MELLLSNEERSAVTGIERGLRWITRGDWVDTLAEELCSCVESMYDTHWVTSPGNMNDWHFEISPAVLELMDGTQVYDHEMVVHLLPEISSLLDDVEIYCTPERLSVCGRHAAHDVYIDFLLHPRDDAEPLGVVRANQVFYFDGEPDSAQRRMP